MVTLADERISWKERIGTAVQACRKVGARRAWVIGSAARGTADELSDLDLVIELETEAAPLDRIAEVKHALGYRFPCDVVVYQPAELQALLLEKQPFLSHAMHDARLIWDGAPIQDGVWVEALERGWRSQERDSQLERHTPAVQQEGRLKDDWTMHDPGAAAQNWLEQAKSDLDSARVLLQGQKYAQSCFFGQQAGEKALKSFLTRSGDRQLFGHDVGALVIRAKQRDTRFAALIGDGAFLDRFYGFTRYPDAWAGGAVPALKYFERDAQEAIAAAERLMLAAEEAIREIDGRHP